MPQKYNIKFNCASANRDDRISNYLSKKAQAQLKDTKRTLLPIVVKIVFRDWRDLVFYTSLPSLVSVVLVKLMSETFYMVFSFFLFLFLSLCLDLVGVCHLCSVCFLIVLYLCFCFFHIALRELHSHLLNKELRSPIFQSLSVSESVCKADIHFVQYIKA